MDAAGDRRQVPVLVGIGLLLVGLLAGILLTLLTQGGPGARNAPQVVERIELGSGAGPLAGTVPSAPSGEVVVDPVRLNHLFKQVAGTVTPAVVYIQVETGGSTGSWFDGIDRRFFRERTPRQSVGSGVVISDDGYIVTNHHVVEDASSILVTLSDKRQYRAEVTGLDPTTDLAVLKIDGDGLPAVAFGDSDAVEVGEWVLAIGNPFRLNSTVTAGIVSALGRQVNIIGDSFGIEDFIQTDAAINPGNSGGALVDLSGRLIGINTAIATESGSYEGYGFAVPVNLMVRVARDLIAFGEVQRGYLGVEIAALDPRVARRLGLESTSGAMLAAVWEGGAAYEGGLRTGDVVLAIEGRGVSAPNELQSAIARHRPGDRVAIDVWRAGRERRFEVELFGRDDPSYERWFSQLRRAAPDPDDPISPHRDAPGTDIVEVGDWGIGLRPISDRERAFFGSDGVYVAYVERGSAAERAGLPRDVVLTGIGGAAIAGTADVLAAVEAASSTPETPVLLRVRRADGTAAFYELAAGRE